ncbi:hypothetical protein FGO68_gene8396 [Halteria grandinella]|uniref:Uncharacterized protein n=1 Tax=Halteria grandinella TaxID=5974 RepID=A0A8J8P1M0_HALGN|nr:hypothetical protein FGO68_gene8396 [Halteria grandinella]
MKSVLIFINSQALSRGTLQRDNCLKILRHVSMSWGRTLDAMLPKSRDFWRNSSLQLTKQQPPQISTATRLRSRTSNSHSKRS